jgi:hypothetical protein
MNRFSAAAAILIYLFLIAAPPATAQSDPQCFPWQELRDGRCVAKPSQLPPPPLAPPPTVSDQCPTGSRSLSGPCTCPPNTHLEGGACVADALPPAPPPPSTALAPQPPAVAPPLPPVAVAPPPPPLPPLLPPPPPQTSQTAACDGGKTINGACACPAGFHVMPINGVALGGRCVKTDAENCLGGELTVSGTCQCNGQVRMSGDVYLLEFVKGKCLPKRCPVQTVFKDGKCITTSAVSPEPATTGSPGPTLQASKEPDAPKNSEDEEERRRCGRGMVRSRSGACVAARRRTNSTAAFQQYYRMYQGQGMPGGN